LGFDESREDFLTEASKAEIVGKNDLADIEGDGDISIDWDFDEADGEKRTVLRRDGKEIGRRPRRWRR
jgi:hypothetical protein